MGEKIPLLQALPPNVSRVAEELMLHVHQEKRVLFARICDLDKVDEKAFLKRVAPTKLFGGGLFDEERKAEFWVRLRKADKYEHLLGSSSDKEIELPPWGYQLLETDPVFSIGNLRPANYAIRIQNLLVDDGLIPHAKPIQTDTEKIISIWPLDNMKWAFSAMVEQKWIQEGAEMLVEKRFTDSKTLSQVEYGVTQFIWLEKLTLLRSVAGFMELKKSKLPPHFLHKRKTGEIKPLTYLNFRTGGHNAQEQDKKARDLLRPFQPS